MDNRWVTTLSGGVWSGVVANAVAIDEVAFRFAVVFTLFGKDGLYVHEAEAKHSEGTGSSHQAGLRDHGWVW